jgi:hypothetical protein
MRAALLLASLGLCACTDTTTIVAADVIVLDVCPDGAPCARVADGRSVMTVRACVPEAVTDRKTGLTAALHVSSGRWSAPSDPTRPGDLTVPLDADRCASPAYVTGTTLDPVRIDATADGLRASAFVEDLQAAPLTSLEVTPSPKVLPAAGGEVSLAVIVRAASGGTPTDGTTVAFAIVDSTPPGAAAFVYPEEVRADGTKASATLALDEAVGAITVRVTATPPAREGEPAGAAVSTDVVMKVKGN